jgi:hypothetical protein
LPPKIPLINFAPRMYVLLSLSKYTNIRVAVLTRVLSRELISK